MNGSPSEALLNPVKVRRLQESNKIFGLEDRETRSDQKLLINFLDNLFNASTAARIKLDKPVRIFNC
jgi:hypothetical protein